MLPYVRYEVVCKRRERGPVVCVHVTYRWWERLERASGEGWLPASDIQILQEGSKCEVCLGNRTESGYLEQGPLVPWRKRTADRERRLEVPWCKRSREPG